MNDSVATSLQHLLDSEMEKQHTHAVLLGVQSKDGHVDFKGSAGDATPDSPYFIASITKMYSTAVIMQLVDAGQLDLDAPLTTYLPPSLTDGIHVYRGTDYSQQLKVYQLIHQTSGLADYFEGKRENGNNVMDNIKQGRDQEYSVKDVLAMIRDMSPQFEPDTNNGRKSHYSDTNYQLLGAIIEAITGQSLAENFHTRIFDRLGLTQTYLYNCHSPLEGQHPLPFYNQDMLTSIPLTVTSERSAGGIVSTLSDSLTFLRAYFEGQLFDQGHFERMMQWNSLFFPIRYGYGLMRFQLPRVVTLFRYSPELIGHSGSSGSFAYYAPKEELYIVGTFNQADKPSRPFTFMLKVVSTIGKS